MSASCATGKARTLLYCRDLIRLSIWDFDRKFLILNTNSEYVDSDVDAESSNLLNGHDHFHGI